MDFKKTSSDIKRVTMHNIPLSMKTNDLAQFCSRFGKVNSITRPIQDRTCAHIEFCDTR